MSRDLCLQLWYCTVPLHPGPLPRRQLDDRISKVWRTLEAWRLELLPQEWFVCLASIVAIFCGRAPPLPNQQISNADEGDASDATHNAADNCSRMSRLGCWGRTCGGSEGRGGCGTGCPCRTCAGTACWL